MSLLSYIGDWVYAIWISFFPGEDDNRHPERPSA